MRRMILRTMLLCFCISASAQTSLPSMDELKQMSDSLTVLMEGRTTVQGHPVIKKALKRGKVLDFYFDAGLGGFAWKEGDEQWLRSTLKDLLPEQSAGLTIGNISAGAQPLRELTTPALTNDGNPASYRYAHRSKRSEFVTKTGAQLYPRGLSGRHIAIWQSHGRYFNGNTGRWEWQRPAMFTTVEDMYTQSYVLPLLIPMLENAGAYVMTPRERDTQRQEFIIDNDASFSGGRDGLTRRSGSYRETGRWKDAGTGFADTARIYPLGVNPFTLGTARMATCSARKADAASITWTPTFLQRGQFAVYVSYKTLPKSTPCARYTVHHMGGDTQFCVDQRKGGGTWIYLGTFEFAEGSQGWITLDNGAPAGHKVQNGTVVTADAVKIGGGMGKIARSSEEYGEMKVSGLPAFAEGAYYSMQWAGVDTTVTNQWASDYTRDYASRGAWTTMMKEEKGIPIDMSLAVHSDAGIRQLDSTVGTLAIYTLRCEGSRKLQDGTDRIVCRGLADIVQEQLCSDVRATFNRKWNRREIWDRSYSESRTTGVPALLIEMLSHQNFNDMKYGLDPAFRFTVSRALYKGALKFLSNLNGEPYTVQPLPVHAFAVQFGSVPGSATLSWENTEDPLEPTATPTGYILYTRVDDGAFDEGTPLTDIRKENGRIVTSLPVSEGHLYSFRVVACNDGGRSFPSETLCIGTPEGCGERRVMVVNNFDRVSGPAWFDADGYGGFRRDIDPGMPYVEGIEYVGDQYETCRAHEYVNDSYPGFGASFTDKAAGIVKGNTFDFVSIHARTLLALGYEVYSVSAEAWSREFTFSESSFAADILCGRQVSTVTGSPGEPCRHQVFPAGLRRTIEEYADGGGNLIISGTNIGTDIWSSVYPLVRDEEAKAEEAAFAERVFGYKWRSGFASRSCGIQRFRSRLWSVAGLPQQCDLHNPDIYEICNPDALSAASLRAFPVLRYDDSGLNAAIYYHSGTHKAASYGFPLETVSDSASLQAIIADALLFFGK